MSIDDRTKVTTQRARFDELNCFLQAIVRRSDQQFALLVHRFTDTKCLIQIAVETLVKNGDLHRQ